MNKRRKNIRLDTTGWVCDSLEIVEEIEIRPYEQMVYAQPKTSPEEWDAQNPLDHLILARRPDLGIINKKKRPCLIVDFAVPVNHRVNLKEKKGKYLDFAKKLKKKTKLWNMKVTVILIINGIFATVTKGLIQGLDDLEIRGRMETIQNIAILRSTRTTEKSPGDLRRLDVALTPVRNHQLTVVWKIEKSK